MSCVPRDRHAAQRGQDLDRRAETLGDLDEGILESASRKGRPAGRVQYQSQQRQRGFEERESSQRRGRERAGAPRREYGKSYTRGSGNKPYKPFTKRGSGM